MKNSKARHFYQFLAWAFQNENDWRFMNYGFAFDDPTQNPTLEPRDEGERYSAQLYHAVASQVDLRGAELLDIGTGRGGGASFMHRYHGAAKTIGIDLASNAIKICNAVNSGIDGLSYRCGDAMDMPFENNVFDAVANVESAHCYPDLDVFFAEVHRVLAPRGNFVFADFSAKNVVGKTATGIWVKALHRAGFRDICVKVITKNVVAGLALDNERRLRQIDKKFPRGTKRFARLWAGTTKSRIYDDFRVGRREYVMIKCKKAA